LGSGVIARVLPRSDAHAPPDDDERGERAAQPVNQYVQVPAPLGAEWMRVYYSTDCWSTPTVVECTPLGRARYVSCGLGYLPVAALLSFSTIVRYPGAPDQYVRASDGGNIQKAL
jgi:hypothetical protein